MEKKKFVIILCSSLVWFLSVSVTLLAQQKSSATNSSRLIPFELRGNWLLESNRNKWVLGLYDSLAFVENKFWKYETISKIKGGYQLGLKNQSERIKIRVSPMQSTLNLSLKNTSYSLSSQKKSQSSKNNLPFPSNLFQDSVLTVKGFIDNKHLTSQNSIRFNVSNIITHVQETYLTEINPNGTFEISIPLLHASADIFFKYDDISDSFMALPGDTLLIYVDYSKYKGRKKTIMNNIFFGGTRGDLNNEKYSYKVYIQSRKKYEPKTVTTLNESDYKKHCSALKASADSLRLSYLKTFGMSKELEELSELDNLYSWADLLISYFSEHAMPMATTLSDEYLSLFTPDLINNPRAVLSEDYHFFINLYRMAKLNNILGAEKKLPTKKAVEFVRKNDSNLTTQQKAIIDSYINRGGKYTEGEEATVMPKIFKHDLVEQFYTAYLNNLSFTVLDTALESGTGKDIALSNYLYSKTKHNVLIEDSLINNYKRAVSNSIAVSQIVQKNNELKERINRAVTKPFQGQKLSSKGSKILNELLEKYKGKAVYIDFWATWCGPCLVQMDAVNGLKDRFKDVVFLYLCSSSTEARWKFVINDKAVKGEHYLLSPDQDNYLKNEFQIGTIPHYVIVNKNGEIIDRNAPGPNQEEKLVQLLDQLTKN